jgi:hypothetical protein
MKDQGRDRNLVSDEPYEIEYIHKQFPGKTHEAVYKAVEKAKKQLKGSESREKIMEIVPRELQ